MRKSNDDKFPIAGVSSQLGANASLPLVRLERLALLAVLLTAATLAIAWPGRLKDVPDSATYVDMADGRIAEAGQPFANRILAPYVAGALHRYGHLSMDSAFLVLDVCCLLVFFAAGGYVLLAATGQWLPAVLSLFLPFTWELFREGYLPDLPHAALLALFLAMLIGGQTVGALAGLLALQLTRESTVLLSLVVAFLAYRRGRKRLAIGAVSASALGMAIVAQVTRHAHSNLHDLFGPLYLLLKFPFNLAHNLAGVLLWTNTLEQMLQNHRPLWTWNLPSWLRVGSIRTIGYCGFFPHKPALTMATWLSQLGIAPTILLVWWRKRHGRLPLWAAVAAGYGAACFLLAPGLGAEQWRLMGYGWPMLLAAAFVMMKIPHLRPSAAMKLGFAHLLTAWGGALLVSGGELLTWELGVLIVFLLAVQAVAARTALKLEFAENTVGN